MNLPYGGSGDYLVTPAFSKAKELTCPTCPFAYKMYMALVVVISSSPLLLTSISPGIIVGSYS